MGIQELGLLIRVRFLKQTAPPKQGSISVEFFYSQASPISFYHWQDWVYEEQYYPISQAVEFTQEVSIVGCLGVQTPFQQVADP